MKIQLGFNYNNLNYQIIIDEDDIDMNHYETMWDYWYHNGEYIMEREVTFEVLADKRIIDGKEIISGNNLSINVYFDEDAIPVDVIKNVDIQYL